MNSRKIILALMAIALLGPYKISNFRDEAYDTPDLRWHWIWLRAPLWSYLSETHDCPDNYYTYELNIPGNWIFDLPIEINHYLLTVEWSKHGIGIYTGLITDWTGHRA